MFGSTEEGRLLWSPSTERMRSSNITRYIEWLKEKRNAKFRGYDELWKWSISDLDAFWASIWDYFSVNSQKQYSHVLRIKEMPGAVWFEGARINYAEHIFRNVQNEKDAILFKSESGKLRRISWDELHRKTASVAKALREMGVKDGDRVVGYIANVPEAVIAFLACASIGAIWSSCSPDFGVQSVVDRFSQIAPKVMFATDGYRYNGKSFDRLREIEALVRDIPTIEKVVIVPYLNDKLGKTDAPNYILFDSLLGTEAELEYEHVPFEHPLWILYSSGTTGLPKPIVQGQGGILLEHLKSVSLHVDIKSGDRFFWFTTTGWMMWNYLVSGLLLGATIMLYDGSPTYPTVDALWRFAEETGMTYFGTSAAYITSCMKSGVEPGKSFDLRNLHSMGYTGSPLPAEGFDWVYANVKKDLLLGSVSGGTDICSLFVGSCPLLPVHSGEIQCRCLGVNIKSYDDAGKDMVDEVGEMVITDPMPSMPLFFWNDEGHKRYRESYFSMYPGKWRHGDWLKITNYGSCVIYGRSDSTIKRHGVRMGTSEIYKCVDGVPEVLDSIIIDLEGLRGRSYMPLFVVMKEGMKLDDGVKDRIKGSIKTNLSPKFVPDEIFEISVVPKTLNGKKMEVPVKKILMGVPVEKAVNKGSVGNLDSLTFFMDMAKKNGSVS